MPLAQRLFNYAYFQSWNWGLWSPPDRKFLTGEIFPRFKKAPTVLFVGVRRYTCDYRKAFADSNFVTIEIDPSLARFGSDRHISDSILNLGKYREAYFPRGLDLIIFNGVIGFGLDKPEEIAAVFDVMAREMNEGGSLVVGTNPRFIRRPEILDLKSVELNFAETPFGEEKKSLYRFRLPFLKDAEHEYLFFARRKNQKLSL